MRPAIFLACCFSLAAQQPEAPLPQAPYAHFLAQMEPSASGHLVAAGRAGFGTRISRDADHTVVHAWVNLNGAYYGCDILLQPRREGGVYLATFQPLSLGGTKITGNSKTSSMGDPSRWMLHPPPAYPSPQLVRLGETIAIDLMRDPASGKMLVGYLELSPAGRGQAINSELKKMSTPELQALDAKLMERLQAVNAEIKEIGEAMLRQHVRRFPSPAPPAAAVAGTPREFSADDAEMEIALPRIRINGEQEPGLAGPEVRGTLPWFYLPGRGRFVLSLIPRAGFEQAGEVEGRVLVVRSGKDTIKLQSLAAIAPESETYIVYVMHDADWRPEAAQAGGPLLGALHPADLKSSH